MEAVIFHERLKELRQQRKETQVQLARALNVTKGTYSNWENGNCMPSVDKLVALADHFQISCDYLLGRNAVRTLRCDGLNDDEVAKIQKIVNEIIQFNKKRNSRKN